MTTQLSAVSRTQGNNIALKNGAVTPRSYTLDFEEIPVLVQGFRRMVRGLEFDVCEMAITTYMCAKAHGTAFTALPAFLVRGFHHDAILYNTRSGITKPKDLEGRRVGVNRGYTVTTGVWARGILQEEYGVDLDQVTWVLSGDEHVAAYVPPDNVVPMPDGTSLEELLIAGEIDAVIGVAIDHPDVAHLIDDPTAVAHRALRDRGLYPINHLVVIKDEVLAAHPDAAAEVFDAFARSKQLYVDRLRAGEIEDTTDQMYAQVMQITGADPLPYGIEANRHTIETLIGHAVSQSIIDTAPDIDGLFAESTRTLQA
jgi:4,5-dihydroxyphthalate decarboxylase